MELCIKTSILFSRFHSIISFNPCFNGTMYKNPLRVRPHWWICWVSILVLMELCIKTLMNAVKLSRNLGSFNPCFNGTMYKNTGWKAGKASMHNVSILVLMELCIKTIRFSLFVSFQVVSILVLMELCIKTYTPLKILFYLEEFQSLF